jgi:hypothetical protein
MKLRPPKWWRKAEFLGNGYEKESDMDGSDHSFYPVHIFKFHEAVGYLIG